MYLMAKIIKTVSFSIIKCTSWQSRSMINIFFIKFETRDGVRVSSGSNLHRNPIRPGSN